MIRLGYITNACEISEAAIPALTKIPATTWGCLPTPFYADETYSCRDCGKKTVWTALEKFQYYEIEKRNMYAKRIRCDACHKKAI